MTHTHRMGLDDCTHPECMRGPACKECGEHGGHFDGCPLVPVAEDEDGIDGPFEEGMSRE